MAEGEAEEWSNHTVIEQRSHSSLINGIKLLIKVILLAYLLTAAVYMALYKAENKQFDNHLDDQIVKYA
jgi:hypothetical protein